MYYLHLSLILKTEKQSVVNYLEITGCDHYAKWQLWLLFMSRSSSEEIEDQIPHVVWAAQT